MPKRPYRFKSHRVLDERNVLLSSFWSRVERGNPDDCWPWKAGIVKGGYGIFKVRQYVRITAHRIAWALANRREPGEGHVCHRCDNPNCCNPHHLFLGNARINARDKVEKGRARGRFSKGNRLISPERHRKENPAPNGGRFQHANLPRKIGREERIRTSGPCLPKTPPKPVGRRKPCVCVSCAAERAKNICGIGDDFTGATPERSGVQPSPITPLFQDNTHD